MSAWYWYKPASIATNLLALASVILGAASENLDYVIIGLLLGLSADSLSGKAGGKS